MRSTLQGRRELAIHFLDRDIPRGVARSLEFEALALGSYELGTLFGQASHRRQDWEGRRMNMQRSHCSIRDPQRGARRRSEYRSFGLFRSQCGLTIRSDAAHCVAANQRAAPCGRSLGSTPLPTWSAHAIG